jgi:hypothetical protein
MKISRNIQHLGIKPWDVSHPGTTKSSTKKHANSKMNRTKAPKNSLGFSCSNAPHHKKHDGIDIHALEVGLRGIVHQYLLDVMEDIKRNKVLRKFGLASEDLEVQSVSSRDCVVSKLLSHSTEEDSVAASTTRLQVHRNMLANPRGHPGTDQQNVSNLNVVVWRGGESCSRSSTTDATEQTSSDASISTSICSSMILCHGRSSSNKDETPAVVARIMKEHQQTRNDDEKMSKMKCAVVNNSIIRNEQLRATPKRIVCIYKATNKEGGDIELYITS